MLRTTPVGGRPRLRARSFFAIAIIAVALLMCAPGIASAATFGSKVPAPASTVNANGTVSVTVSGIVGSVGSYGMTVDGKTIWPWQMNVTRPSPTSLKMTSVAAIAYGDGPHTATVTLTDSAGTWNDSWTFSAQIKPTISVPYPTPGSTVGVGRPKLSAQLADNSAGTLRVWLYIDSVLTYSGTVPQGTWAFIPSSDLANNQSHVAWMSVSDMNGNTATYWWSFTVVAAPAMTVAPTCSGSTCHPTYPSAHPMGDCEGCHYARADITPGPNHQYYYVDDLWCTDCHDQHTPRDLSRWACDTCHSPASPQVPQHTSANTAGDHVSAPSGSCADCHDTQLLAEHAKYPKKSVFKNQCDTCHSGTSSRVATAVASKNRDCLACHDLSAAHSAHPSSVTSGTVHVFDSHDVAGAVDWQADCDTCHASMDLIVVHEGRCLACHGASGPITSFDDWNGTCQQGACHPTIHASASAAHDKAAKADCSSCHDADWSVPPDVCERCHTAHDTVAPNTVSNAKANYIGSAVIRLTSTDPLPSGGSGNTYYRLDGGQVTTGTVVTVVGPLSGSRQHVLEFWAVDHSGNRETTKSATFTIEADLEAPVTLSNLKASYIGLAQIAFTPLDAGDPEGLKTYYRLDGATAVQGTSLTVEGPAAGTQNHTIEYWSVDGAGNVEFPHKTATFSVTTDKVPPVTTSNAPRYDRTTTLLKVDFTASDPTPGSGVAATYYRVDGGATLQGTMRYIDIGTHTLEFWSVDNAGNEELPHKTAVVTKDPWAPTTSSNAVAKYVESATVSLWAVDAGDAGVAATYYSLDDAAQVAGTSVTCATVGTHTLRFWSVDKAGNVEAPKSVVFVVDPKTPPVVATGSVVFRWDDPPPGSWTYYYVYDSVGGLVATDYNTSGICTIKVPVSTEPYTLRAYWFDPENVGYPEWSYGTALIDSADKVVTWYY